MRPHARSGGFTLVEVLVALAIGSILLYSASRLFVQLGGAADEIASAAKDADREANTERLLRTLFGRLDLGEGPLAGDSTEVRFVSWCETPAGWLERCPVKVSRQDSWTGLSLQLELADGEIIEIGRASQSAEILYLSAPDHGGSWLPSWMSSITAPIAIGLVLDRDTIIVRIGERG